MGNRYIHKNLDTSFVNLSALIKYLRRRQFIGGIEVKLNGYRADVLLGIDNSIRVFEHDEISGRQSEGEEALQRLLIRSREPGGTISVLQSVIETHSDARNPTNQNPETPAISMNHISPVSQDRVIAMPKEELLMQREVPKPEIELPTYEEPEELKQKSVRHSPSFSAPGVSRLPLSQNAIPAEGIKMTTPKANNVSHDAIPNFPFELSNRFENKAKEVTTSPEDWQTLLRLTVELLTVIDRSIAEANLDFSNEFRKICAEISDDYPFLSPNMGTFRYDSGKIAMQYQMNAKMFVGGISEALRRILVKLSRSSKYAVTYNSTSQRLQTLIQRRAGIYEKYDIASQVRRIVSP